MTTTAETFWKARYDDAIRQAYCERTYGAAHPPPQPRDLINFCFDLGSIELAAIHLERDLRDADECGAMRGPTLRRHLPELRHMQAELAGLVAEAEAA